MTTYRAAPAVERIAAELIPEHHPELVDVRIEYVFRDKPAKSAGREIWGKARKVSGLNAYLATPAEERGFLDLSVDDFFVIEIAEQIWKGLDDKQRRALVDHELMHCTTELDEETDEVKLVLRPHDLEEFRAIVTRHGFWRPDVVAFAKTVEGQLTLDLDTTPA